MINRSYALHPDMKNPSGIIVTLGKGDIYH